MRPLDSNLSKNFFNNFKDYFSILTLGLTLLIVNTLFTKTSAIISSLVSKKNSFINDQLRNHSLSSSKNSSCCITIIPFATKNDAPLAGALNQEDSVKLPTP